MFRATMCPFSGADDCVVLSPRVGVVPWLQEGCQNRLAGSVSTEEFGATNCSMDTLPVVLWLQEGCHSRLAGSVSIVVLWLQEGCQNRLAGSVSIVVPWLQEVCQNRLAGSVSIVVPWLQEGCQSWLAGSVSIEGFVARHVLVLCRGCRKAVRTG